ncbi:MAG: ADP-ribosylglycohydrolase family protein [Armatimonadota bacterium]
MNSITRKNWAKQPWMLLENHDLITERNQCADEGIDISSVQAELEELISADLTVEENQQRAENLMVTIQSLPRVEGYPRSEPSDLAGIQAVRPSAVDLPALSLSDDALLDKATGGWQGRASGCLLGKPAEGRRAWQIEKYVKAQDRWPLSAYFSANAPEDLAKECGFDISNKSLFEEGIDRMPEDDDTNYTATGLAIVKQQGADFTPEGVASFWLSNIPLFHVCTAERVAYRNLSNCIPPPQSAFYLNASREWIGAQIRADFFGYVNPGNPERAADFAWRDASISHIKNGIYGEMWVAAMLAAAYVSDDVETVIRAGLAQVPAESRLTSGVEYVLNQYKSGISYEDAVADLHKRWDENLFHHWCHTISNAEIVAIALLWGEKDFEKTICMSVMPAFDTDCNGATSGSVLGIILGASKLPSKWIAPMNDTLITGVAGYHSVSLTQMGRETVELIHKIG